MALENADYISGLNASNPTVDDPISQGDDHIRTLKKVLLQSFPEVDGPVAPPVAPVSANSTIRSNGSEWVESTGVTISAADELSASKVSTGDLDASGTVSAQKVDAQTYEGGNMSLTGNISAAAFYGDGSNLANLPSGYDGWRINGTQVNSNDNVRILAGSNVTVNTNGRDVTISASGGGTSSPSYTAGNGISINSNQIQMSGSYNGNFSVQGSITASSNVTAYSDDRLKTRTGDVEDALGKIKQLDTFRYIANEEGEKVGMGVHEQLGVSAQQVQQVAPEAVYETDTGHLSVDYSRLVVLCIEAIKQLEAR